MDTVSMATSPIQRFPMHHSGCPVNLRERQQNREHTSMCLHTDLVMVTTARCYGNSLLARPLVSLLKARK